MKNQALFSWTDKSKKLKCRLQQFSFGALRIKVNSVAVFHRKKFTLLILKCITLKLYLQT